MKIGLYTKTMLTIIAACLIFLVLGVGDRASRYQMVTTEHAVVRMNSATGETWVSDGCMWERIEEPE